MLHAILTCVSPIQSQDMLFSDTAHQYDVEDLIAESSLSVEEILGGCTGDLQRDVVRC